MRRKYKGLVIILSLFIICLSILIGAGCGDKDVKELKIGAILPLTGRLSFLGNSIKNGLLLASSEINKDKHFVKIFFEDTKGEAKEAVSAANKLINIDKVHALITYPSAASEAILPIAKDHKIIHLSFTMDPELASRSEYTFNIFPTADQEIIVMTNYLKNTKPEKIGVLYVMAPAHEQTVKGELLPRLKTIGYEDDDIHIETFNIRDIDIKNQMLKLKNFGANLIIVFIYPPLLDNFFKTLSETGLYRKVKVLGNMGFVGKIKTSPEITEGTIFTAPPFYFKQKGKIVEILNRYKKVFNSFPEPSSALFPYDALHILYNCLSAKNGDIEKTKECLSKVKDYPGITGKIEILPNGNAKTIIGLGVIKNGNLSEYR